MEISLTFPCHDEEANVARSVERALDLLPQLCTRFEVIVVDDGSRDGTRAIAQSLVDAHPETVRLLSWEDNRGYGAAVRAGLSAGRYEWLFFTDGDLQFELAEMRRLLPLLETHDIVSGYRGRRRDPVHRRAYGRGWSLLGRALFGIPVRDLNCAFRFIRSSLFEQLALRSDGAMMNMELYARARKLGARIAEVEVTHFPRRAGSASGGAPRVVLRAFGELVSLWRELR